MSGKRGGKIDVGGVLKRFGGDVKPLPPRPAQKVKRPKGRPLRHVRPEYDNEDIKLQPLVGDRFPHESNAAVMACNDYLRLGVRRSVERLRNNYKARVAAGEEGIPSVSLNTIQDWCMDYMWKERAEIFDGMVDAKRTEDANAAMNTGLALPYERVTSLKRLAAYLEGYVYDPARLWLVDYRTLGFGKYAEYREVIRFNNQLVEQFRGVLDDLAKETGGRIHRQELSGVGGGPIPVALQDLDDIRDKVKRKLESLTKQPD